MTHPDWMRLGRVWSADDARIEESGNIASAAEAPATGLGTGRQVIGVPLAGILASAIPAALV